MNELILIIEDTEFIREDIAMTLSFEDYRTITAADGVEGLEMIREHTPDLILCDVSMPRLDGFGVLKELRNTKEGATIPFIFLTAKAEKADMRVGMELGADDYLTKPFSTGELIAAIRSQLGKKRKVEAHIEEKLDSLRNNISYALPHEFRTALIGIVGYAEVLSQTAKAGQQGTPISPDDLLEMSTDLRISATRLQRLTENFLVYSQLQTLASNPRASDDLCSFILSSIAEASQDVMHGRLALSEDRKGDVSVTIHEDVALTISPLNFNKLLYELLDNALKFSQPGSPVAIEAQPDGGMVKITVTDKGRGMSAEQINNIGAYQQFDRKTHEQQGAGLGLVIAQLLAQLHRGTLSVEAAANQGCTVTVRLPIATDEDIDRFFAQQ